LQADAIKLTQIVTNLLTNAVKYTPAGGFIRLSAQRDGERGEVQVRVLDTGIGIVATQLHRIFDMFVRGNDPNAESCAGLGIGLALARQLATLHGGSISVHSDGPGLGSEFVLTLPGERRERTTINVRSAPVLSVQA
jgi:signal transduction histidine kinase